MTKGLPAWASQPRRLDAAAGDHYARMTPQERWLELLELLDLSDRVLQANPNGEQVRWQRDELPDSSRRHWQRLMQEHRRASTG